MLSVTVLVEIVVVVVLLLQTVDPELKIEVFGLQLIDESFALFDGRVSCRVRRLHSRDVLLH